MSDHLRQQWRRLAALAPCVYCKAPWYAQHVDPVHLTDCPMVTGVMPVRPQDVEPHGFCCVECGEPFRVGDWYLRRRWDDRVSGVTCFSCAAQLGKAASVTARWEQYLPMAIGA